MHLGHIKKSAKTKWNIQADNFQTMAIILAGILTLSQFTTKRTFKTTFHILQKQINPSFDVITGRNIEQQPGLNILNSTKQLQWSEIPIPMVPKWHWKKKHSIHKSRQEQQEIRKIIGYLIATIN